MPRTQTAEAEAPEQPTQDHTATYSPEDDKIRIYPAYRLPTDEYQQLKTAGYSWAPKQECFYAVWSPHREATALQFAPELDDEDRTLVDRAEERADRFETYSEHRTRDAEQAHAGVKAIADMIPFGQPILVGHHSEKHARRDAERIENGMRRAVKMWDTAAYWENRAAGALAHAKYKERPDVRARRIKTIEADKRKRERTRAEAEMWLKKWTAPDLTLEQAINIAKYCHLDMPRKPEDRPDFTGTPSAYTALTNSSPTLFVPRTVEEVVAHAAKVYPRIISHCNAWIAHFNNRLAYERAMLAEGGGLKSDSFNLEIGGQIKRRGEWMIITKINRIGGAISSVSVIGHWAATVPVEEIQEYKAPAEGDSEKVKAATKMPPMCNYITPDCATMTQADYTKQYKDHKGSQVIKATDSTAAHRIRTVSSFIGRRFGSPSNDQWGSVTVFISDAKVTQAPPLANTATPKPALPATEYTPPRPAAARPQAAEPTPADALRATLKAGIQVVTAPQLFPTPPELAARMVELAEIQPGQTILEPSAGTGNLLTAIMNDDTALAVIAVEINQQLADRLKTEYPLTNVQCQDFLTFDRGNYPVDCIIMNPPFAPQAADIQHIKYALTMLKPGGRLVALCANGPRQQTALQPLADLWEVLPPGSFAAEGTNVNVVLLVINKPTAGTKNPADWKEQPLF